MAQELAGTLYRFTRERHRMLGAVLTDREDRERLLVPVSVDELVTLVTAILSGREGGNAALMRSASNELVGLLSAGFQETAAEARRLRARMSEREAAYSEILSKNLALQTENFDLRQKVSSLKQDLESIPTLFPDFVSPTTVLGLLRASQMLERGDIELLSGGEPLSDSAEGMPCGGTAAQARFLAQKRLLAASQLPTASVNAPAESASSAPGLPSEPAGANPQPAGREEECQVCLETEEAWVDACLSAPSADREIQAELVRATPESTDLYEEPMTPAISPPGPLLERPLPTENPAIQPRTASSSPLGSTLTHLAEICVQTEPPEEMLFDLQNRRSPHGIADSEENAGTGIEQGLSDSASSYPAVDACLGDSDTFAVDVVEEAEAQTSPNASRTSESQKHVCLSKELSSSSPRSVVSEGFGDSARLSSQNGSGDPSIPGLDESSIVQFSNVATQTSPLSGPQPPFPHTKAKPLLLPKFDLPACQGSMSFASWRPWKDMRVDGAKLDPTAVSRFQAMAISSILAENVRLRKKLDALLVKCQTKEDLTSETLLTETLTGTAQQ